MVKGTFIEDIPLIPVLVTWNQLVQASYMVLDTGFTGDLQVTPKIAKELGLKPTGVTPARIANGEVVPVLTAPAFVTMEGETSHMQVLISESMPLAGISFLTKFGYTAIVDCKNREVSLEKA